MGIFDDNTKYKKVKIIIIYIFWGIEADLNVT